jgi:hypothetical protein
MASSAIGFTQVFTAMATFCTETQMAIPLTRRWKGRISTGYLLRSQRTTAELWEESQLDIRVGERGPCDTTGGQQLDLQTRPRCLRGTHS